MSENWNWHVFTLLQWFLVVSIQSVNIQLWLWFLCFLCLLSRWHLCVWAGRERVWWPSDCENTNTDIWFSSATLLFYLPASMRPNTWNRGTDYWSHFRFYTSAKSHFTLLKDCQSFISMVGGEFRVNISGVMFSHLYTLITSATEVNCHRQP